MKEMLFQKVMPLWDVADGMGGEGGAEFAEPAELAATEMGSGGSSFDETGAEESEFAEPVSAGGRRTEADMAFAAMRREAEQSRAEAEQLREILGEVFGDADDPVLAARAIAEGKDPELLALEMEAEQELLRLVSENEQLRQFQYQTQIENDLNAIRKAYPEVQVKSVDDLGPDFIAVMATGTVDAVTAYDIVQSRKQRESITPPPEVGAVNTGDSAEKTFFTRDEVRGMSRDEVHKNYEKIRKSMMKWTK